MLFKLSSVCIIYFIYIYIYIKIVKIKFYIDFQIVKNNAEDIAILCTQCRKFITREN